MERDPREDPQPGDVLLYGGIKIEVLSLSEEKLARVGIHQVLVYQISFAPPVEWCEKRCTHLEGWKSSSFISESGIIHTADE